jgi:hypothetical protein
MGENITRRRRFQNPYLFDLFYHALQLSTENEPTILRHTHGSAAVHHGTQGRRRASVRSFCLQTGGLDLQETVFETLEQGFTDP